MQRSAGGPTPFTVAWLILIAAMFVSIGVFGAQIAGHLGKPVAQSGTRIVAQATSAPSIVTDYTPLGTESTETLCSQLSPRPATVTVESPSGKILSKLECPTGITPPGVSGIIPPEPCIYSESPDGRLIVMSQKTGSVLSAAQAVNCTK